MESKKNFGSEKKLSSLCIKFQPSSTPPSDRFWWGVLVLVLVLVLVVTGVKQSQLLVLRLSLEFDKNLNSLKHIKKQEATFKVSLKSGQ